MEIYLLTAMTNAPNIAICMLARQYTVILIRHATYLLFLILLYTRNLNSFILACYDVQIHIIGCLILL